MRKRRGRKRTVSGARLLRPRPGPRPRTGPRVGDLIAAWYAGTAGGTPAKQLEWAVAFAARENLAALPPEELYGLRRDLTGLLQRGPTRKDGRPVLVTEATLLQAHARYRRVVEHWLTHRATPQDPDVRVAVRVGCYPPGHPRAGHPYIDAHPSGDDDVQAAVLRLLFLIAEEGLRVQRCAAPAPRVTTACGRWFVGRPNARYCSRACYNRAASRRFREKGGRGAGPSPRA